MGEAVDVGTKQARLRLVKARQALSAVEETQGVRSYAQRTFGTHMAATGSALPCRGVFTVGAATEALVKAVQSVFTDQAWVAVVGVGDLGWEAAQNVGWDLRRVAVVECPAPQGATVLSTLLEGFDVLVAGDLSLSGAEQRTIAARARTLDRLILTKHRWVVSSGNFDESGQFSGERWGKTS